VATTVPDAVDAAELALRYQAAIDAINSNEIGLAANVVVTDITDADVADYLSTHCTDALTDGVFRICIVAPPIGTSLADAQDDEGDGVDRSSLDGSRSIYVHPGVKRRFTRDTSLTGAVAYPGQAFAAALVCKARVEENPAVASEVGVAAGVIGSELTLNKAQKVAHFRANIMQPAFEFLNARRVMAYRDGIMADGTKIADRRLQDWVAAGLIATITPYHKRVATPSNRQAALDACVNWLQRQKTPPAGAAPRFANYAVSTDWDAENEHLQLNCVVQKFGNMDVLTIRLSVTAENIEQAV
jgi:hypothetical protein